MPDTPKNSASQTDTPNLSSDIVSDTQAYLTQQVIKLAPYSDIPDEANVQDLVEFITTYIESQKVEWEREARIDELNGFSEWINKGLAETHRIRRLNELSARKAIKESNVD